MVSAASTNTLALKYCLFKCYITMKMKRSVVCRTCSCISWCWRFLDVIRKDEELSATQGHGHGRVFLHALAAYQAHTYALATRLLGDAAALESPCGDREVSPNHQVNIWGMPARERMWRWWDLHQWKLRNIWAIISVLLLLLLG